MTWPDLSDYQEAIQNTRSCFSDPELRAGTVACNKLGLPRAMSGNFASVYEVHNGRRRWAVRCFARQVSDQQHRYALLSQHLGSLSLESLVEFEYLPEGIRVRNQWYPIVKMEWVEGQALHSFVGGHVGDAQTLLLLAKRWRGLVNSLRGNRMAHGDLQHGNILVTDQGQLRLVDYDGMFVPPLRGERSPELGHPNFQHPGRDEAVYDEGLDGFAALVIYTSLRALAADARLWKDFHTGENLILSAGDYKAPGQSAALRRLEQSADAGVRELKAELERSCQSEARSVPEFESVVAAVPPTRDVSGKGTKASISLVQGGSVPWYTQTTLAQINESEPLASTATVNLTSAGKTTQLSNPVHPSTTNPTSGSAASNAVHTKYINWLIALAGVLVIAFLCMLITHSNEQQEKAEQQEQLNRVLQREREEAAKREEGARRQADLERRRANPIEVVEHGVALKEPQLYQARDSYSGLGYPRKSFYVYAVLRNNLYNLEDQETSAQITVRWPDRDVTNQKYSNRKINSYESEDLIWGSWFITSGGSVPRGRYTYTVKVNGRVMAEGSFKVP